MAYDIFMWCQSLEKGLKRLKRLWLIFGVFTDCFCMNSLSNRIRCGVKHPLNKQEIGSRTITWSKSHDTRSHCHLFEDAPTVTSISYIYEDWGISHDNYFFSSRYVNGSQMYMCLVEVLQAQYVCRTTYGSTIAGSSAGRTVNSVNC